MVVSKWNFPSEGTSSETKSTTVRQDVLVCQEERKLLKTTGLMAKWYTGYCEGAPLIQGTAVEASKNGDREYIHTGNMKMRWLSVILNIGVGAQIATEWNKRKSTRVQQNPTVSWSSFQVVRMRSGLSEHWQLKEKNHARILLFVHKCSSFYGWRNTLQKVWNTGLN